MRWKLCVPVLLLARRALPSLLLEGSMTDLTSEDQGGTKLECIFAKKREVACLLIITSSFFASFIIKWLTCVCAYKKASFIILFQLNNNILLHNFDFFKGEKIFATLKKFYSSMPYGDNDWLCLLICGNFYGLILLYFFYFIFLFSLLFFQWPKKTQ